MATGAFDTVAFKSALNEYSKVSSKDFADVVNHAAKEACFKARPKIPLMKLASLNKHKPSKRNSKRRQGRLLYALAARRGFTRGGGIQAEAEKAFNRRKSAKGYQRLQLLGAARDLGAPIRVRLPSPKSGAAEAYAEKAQRFKLYAMVYSGTMNSRGLDMLETAYATALQAAGESMREYARKKMAKTAKKFSST